jgi:FkbM family methyltransferase
MLTKPEKDYSQYGEQPIILNCLSRLSVRPYCVDAGAFHGINGSNSRALFASGWQGIVIEPNARSFARLSALYADDPNVICVQVALSDTEETNATLRVSIGPQDTPEEDKWQYGQVSTFDRAFAGTYERDYSYIYEDQKVDVSTLTKVLEASGSPRDIGFMSVDCEGYDLKIMLEFDFDKFRPSLICVESDDNSRPFFAEILAAKGYLLHAKTCANSLFVAGKS